MLAHSWKELGFKFLAGSLALALLIVFVWVTPANDEALITDKIALGIVATATIAVLIMAVFLAELLFVAPFQMYRAEWERAQAAEARCASLIGSGPVRDRTSLLDACMFLITGEWDCDPSDLADQNDVMRLVDALGELTQAAHENVLSIWGRENRHSGVFQRINPEVWAEQHVEWFAFLERDARTQVQGPSTATLRFPTYYGLCVSKADTEKLRS